MPEINGINVPFVPIGGTQDLKQSPSRISNRNNPIDFNSIFTQELNKLKFSNHAQTRMISREISLDKDELNRLESAITKVDSKNGRESLVMLDDKAFIVNVPNRTVVTLFTKEQLQDDVVTNIDSAVFA
jgi:flagellar operon protein